MRLVLCCLVLLGCGPKEAAPAPVSPVSPATPAPITTAAAPIVELTLKVDASGFTPSELRAPAGAKARLVITRTTDATCAKEIKFPALSLERQLPLDTAVAIDITVPATGRLRFTCGMGMYEGAVVAIP